MAKKEITAPTGEYAIKMPTVVSISAENVPVVEKTQKIRPAPTFGWWILFFQRLLLMFLLFLCILLMLHQKRHYLFTGDYWAKKIENMLTSTTPSPTPAPNVRYIHSNVAYLYEEPPSQDQIYMPPRIMLRAGDIVELGSETHQTPDGTIWFQVRYSIIAGTARMVREGWIDARSLGPIEPDCYRQQRMYPCVTP